MRVTFFVSLPLSPHHPPSPPRSLFPAVETSDLINYYLFVKDVSFQHKLSGWGDECL